MRWLRTAVTAALVLVACGGDTGATLEFDESPDRIEVVILSGDVTISGNANVSGTSVATIQDAGQPQAMIELMDGVLTVGDDCTDSEDCRMSFSISVEGDADVVVTTGAGNVTVGNVSGTIALEVEDGEVNLTTVVGDLTVTIGSGGVLGTRLQSTTAAIDTGAGDIDVTFDEPVASLTAVTGEGDLTVQLPDSAYAFETDAPNGSVDLLVDDDQAASNTVSLATARGDITVYRR